MVQTNSFPLAEILCLVFRSRCELQRVRYVMTWVAICKATQQNPSFCRFMLRDQIVTMSNFKAFLRPNSFLKPFLLCKAPLPHPKSTLQEFTTLRNPIMHLYYPPRLLHNHCLQFLLGHENVDADFWGVKEMYYGIRASSEYGQPFSFGCHVIDQTCVRPSVRPYRLWGRGMGD